MIEIMSALQDATIAACDELMDLDWVRIGDRPYVMKTRFEEDGCTVIISDFFKVYGDRMDQNAVLERFGNLNPLLEVHPNVILKRLKDAFGNIVPIKPTVKDTKLTVTYDNKKFFYFDIIFYVNGVRHIFYLEPKILSVQEFKAYVIKPTLLKALTLDEENAALRRKIEELEGRYSSSSTSGCSERENMKSFYSALKKSDLPKADICDAFLYVLNDKKTSPEIIGTAKGFGVSLKSENVISKLEDSAISMNVEKSEKDDADFYECIYAEMDECDNVNNNVSVNVKNEESNNPVSPKKEIAAEDSKEESTTKPMP